MDISNTPLTGETYTLAQLLGGELSMVIPAMQRDFCWGTDGVSEHQPKEKVTTFIKGLLHLYINDCATTLGLLYGYENPPGSNHIHIIDGQQRLTTLYLLLGMLYRRTPTPELRRLLISDYAMIDDREPSLIYQVRNEAMYFMSDLVMNFFLNRDGRLSQLEKSNWYCKAYDADATVQSFIGAIRCIDRALEEADLDVEWDFGAFAYFVTNRLSFLFYDLGTRSNAEEMFVTINTTGEPLTRPQTLKTMLLTMSDDKDVFIERWAEMEQWFWINRDKTDGGCSTSDAGFDAFIGVWLYSNKQDMKTAFDRVSIDGLYNLFCAYRRLAGAVPEARDYVSTNAASLFMLMPMLAYVSIWDGDGCSLSVADIRRMWHLLHNVSRYQKAGSAGAELLAALDIVDMLPEADILSILTVPDIDKKNNKVLNAEEITKLRFIASQDADRAEAEEVLSRAEAHPMLNGRCSKLIAWAVNRHDDPREHLDTLKSYTECIYRLWGEDINERADLDDLRRALLTVPSVAFPIVRRGDTILSLCWYDYDWQRLMTQAPGLVRQIIDRVRGREGHIGDILKEMAARYTDRSNPYFFLIKNEAALSRCQRRALMRPCLPFIGLRDIDAESTHWFVEQSGIKYDPQRWAPFRVYGTRCLYTDHRRMNLAVDLYYSERESKPYRIEIFSRPDPESTKVAVNLSRLIEALPVKFVPRSDRYVAYFTDASTAMASLHTILRVC